MGVKSEYISNVDEIVKEMDSSKYKKLLAASEFARNRLIERLGGMRSGKTGYLPTGGAYTMSAVGEAPASRTGQLRDNIDYEITKDNAYIGTPLEYGLKLEKGIGLRGPRPWLNITLSSNQKTIQDILGSRWF